jgi:hypothetical protein
MAYDYVYFIRDEALHLETVSIARRMVRHQRIRYRKHHKGFKELSSQDDPTNK